MGALFARKQSVRIKMKCVLIALVLVSFAFASNDFDSYEETDTQFTEEAPEESLVDVAKHLQKISPSHMALHTGRIAQHAELIMDGNAAEKAKAYAHNFKKSKAAINAALNGLTGQLNTGHKHDKAALSGAKARGNAALKKAESAGASKCKSYKAKSCPAKRTEENAKKKKDAAKKKMSGVEKRNICGLRTTYGDMNVDKSVPAFGIELRNKWDKARSEYLKSKRGYDTAKRVHDAAVAAYNKAMAAFRTSLRIEAANALSQCKSAHKEYEALKKEVASNVAMRKQVWIATLVVKCYIDNVTSNSAAKKCADHKRKSSTSRWNISAGSLAACKSVPTLTSSYGPAGWKPTSKNCKGLPSMAPTPSPKACKSALRFKSATRSGNTHGHKTSQFGGQKAIDGNAGTRVGIAGTWQGDFGKVVRMSSLIVSWEACQCRKANSVLVQVSADGRHWKKWGAFGGWHQWGGRKTKTLNGSAHVPVRFVRLVGTSAMQNRWMSMWSIDAKGC